MQGRVVIGTVASQGAKFQRAALVRANVKDKLISVVQGPDVEGEPHLLHVVDAVYLLGLCLRFEKGGHQHSARQRDHGHEERNQDPKITHGQAGDGQTAAAKLGWRATRTAMRHVAADNRWNPREPTYTLH